MVSIRIEHRIDCLDERAYRKQWYAAFLSAVCSVIPKPYPFELTVVLVDDRTIRSINREHRGMDKITDVLSFYYPPESSREKGEGELIISLPQALRQSKRYKTSFVKEMARLVIHGLLHIEGYDHMKTGERKIMRGYEKSAIDVAQKK
ncbi:MAG: rRNA maturation RNase YbeY, partial [bacterium]|nr:rRNA maturation RNase YbeY [bacterium]